MRPKWKQGFIDDPTSTAIRVDGQTWFVPRGFGTWYKAYAKGELTPSCIRDCIELIGYTASDKEIEYWGKLKRVQAIVYAVNVHLRASDNPIRRHPKPDWITVDPWKGSSDTINPKPTSLDFSVDGR